MWRGRYGVSRAREIEGSDRAGRRLMVWGNRPKRSARNGRLLLKEFIERAAAPREVVRRGRHANSGSMSFAKSSGLSAGA
jgi:hypothetical protein